MPYGPRNSTHQIKDLLESKPLISRSLVHGLAVVGQENVRAISLSPTHSQGVYGRSFNSIIRCCMIFQCIGDIADGKRPSRVRSSYGFCGGITCFSGRGPCDVSHLSQEARLRLQVASASALAALGRYLITCPSACRDRRMNRS